MKVGVFYAIPPPLSISYHLYHFLYDHTYRTILYFLIVREIYKDSHPQGTFLEDFRRLKAISAFKEVKLPVRLMEDFSFWNQYLPLSDNSCGT